MADRVVVVAGASGYLGRYVLQALASRGWRVRALVREPARLGWAREFCHEIVVGDLTRPETLEGLFKGATAGFCSAGVRHLRRRPTYYEVDYLGNLALVRRAAAEGVERFVFVSVINGERMRRISPAVEARERVVDELKGLGMSWAVLRPTGFFNDMAELFRLARGGMVWVVGEGTTRINPIHGADLAEVAAELIDPGAGQGQVPVGGPEVFTQVEIAELAFKVLGKPPKIGHIPPWTLKLLGRVARPLNPNLAAFALMFSALAETDAVGPPTGSHRLEEFFRSLAKHG